MSPLLSHFTQNQFNNEFLLTFGTLNVFPADTNSEPLLRKLFKVTKMKKVRKMTTDREQWEGGQIKEKTSKKKRKTSDNEIEK